MRQKLTDRQREIYEFIARTIRDGGAPPTIRETMDAFNIASTNGVRTTLAALEEKGYISRRPMVSRGIELMDYVEREYPGESASREVPVIGRVAAGEPILATENVESTVAVDRSFLPAADVFVLRVKGESMRDAGILDGDYVVARQQDTANPGEIVVAVIGEEATVKRYFPEAGRVRLIPENEAFEAIEVRPGRDDFRIAGKIVGLMRRF